MELDPELVSQQVLRALRGERSQVWLARRLGYRGNPVADWEHGRRQPTASEALRVCVRTGVDVPRAFARFHPSSAPRLGDGDDAGIAAWLDEIRGGASVADLSRAAGLTRHQVGRWLTGAARPRLPDFLRVVEAATGRVSDLLAELVPIERVPALAEVHAARTASKRLAFDEPWTAAVLRLLETEAYRAMPHAPGWIAARLGIPAEVEARCVAQLRGAGILAEREGRWVEIGPLTVDTRAEAGRMAALKAHWAQVAVDRVAEQRPSDLLSYNLCSVSEGDLARIRELHRAYFREVRQIVAASEPCETVALVLVGLVEWPVRG